MARGSDARSQNSANSVGSPVHARVWLANLTCAQWDKRKNNQRATAARWCVRPAFGYLKPTAAKTNPLPRLSHCGAQRRALDCASCRRRTRQASCDPREGRRSGRSLVEGSQLRSIIGYEDGEQGCRLGRAGVLADEMLAARGLEKAFSRRVHLGRTCPGALRADRS